MNYYLVSYMSVYLCLTDYTIKLNFRPITQLVEHTNNLRVLFYNILSIF